MVPKSAVNRDFAAVAASSTRPGYTGPIRSRRVATAAAFAVLAAIPALAAPDTIRAASGLWPIAAAPHPYFVPEHWSLLYLRAPLVAMSAVVLLLSPGLFLSLALGAARSVGAWVVSGLALSLVVVSTVTAIVQIVAGAPIRSGAFAAIVALCAAVGCIAWYWRLGRRPDLAWPFARDGSGVLLAWMIVLPMLLLIGLAPKFYWESFNGDGAHAYESARLLLARALPFWPAAAGDIAEFPGLTSMLFAYPASWFIRLFGELEVSARLPYLVYLPALLGVVVELAEHGRDHRLRGLEHALVGLSLVVYTVALGFSATYDPYSADLALPATQDTLTVVCFLGFVLASIEQRWGWTCAFAALTYVSLPSGAMLMALWLGALAWAWTPRPWRMLRVGGLAVMGCAVAAALIPRVLTAAHLPSPGGEYAGAEMLSRFAFLQLTDVRRVAFVAVPAGILPACALVAWRHQDRVSRCLTLVTVAYFAFFFIQARAAFHHFVPAMLLPLVVFWRFDILAHPRWRRALLAGAAVAGAVSLWLSLPTHGSPNIAARIVGSSIDDRVGGYPTLDPATFRRSTLLHQLFPYDLESTVPAESYGGSPLAWSYYAHQATGPRAAANYVLQSTALPAAGMRAVASDGDVTLYVRSDAVWAAHRALRPPAPAGAAIYAIPRELLFGPLPGPGGPRVLNVQAALESHGVPVKDLLLEFGLRH
jgi:hypothetical protein